MASQNPEQDPTRHEPAPPTPKTIDDFLTIIDTKLSTIPPRRMPEFPGMFEGHPVRFRIHQTPAERMKSYKGIAGASVRPAGPNGEPISGSLAQEVHYIVIPEQDGTLHMRRLPPIDPQLIDRVASTDPGIDPRRLFELRDELEAQARTTEHELGLDTVGDAEVLAVTRAIAETLSSGPQPGVPAPN